MKIARIVTHHKNPERAAELYAEQGVVAVGFDVGDPTGKSRDELKELFINEWGMSEGEAAAATASLLRFRDEIDIGDIVLAYKRHGIVALVGEIIGAHEYNVKNVIGDPEGEIRYPNQRKVKWRDQPRNFDRSYLPEDLSERIALPGTIHVFDYDFGKLKESLDRVPSEEVQERVVEVTDEDEIKSYLRRNPHDLEEGLTIIEPEHEVSVGAVDFLAKDNRGTDTLVEVKVEAKDDVVGQILGYMQAYKEEKGAKEIRGIVVAEQFTERCKKAFKGLNVTLYQCKKRFDFTAL